MRKEKGDREAGGGGRLDNWNKKGRNLCFDRESRQFEVHGRQGSTLAAVAKKGGGTRGGGGEGRWVRLQQGQSVLRLNHITKPIREEEPWKPAAGTKVLGSRGKVRRDRGSVRGKKRDLPYATNIWKENARVVLGPRVFLIEEVKGTGWNRKGRTVCALSRPRLRTTITYNLGMRPF